MQQFETGITAHGLFESEGIFVGRRSRRSIVANTRSLLDVMPAAPFCTMMTKYECTNQDIDRIKATIGIFGPARDANALALSVRADISAARLIMKFDGDV